jgi:hypothetical protein
MGILCCFQSGADKLDDAAAPNKKQTSSDGGLATLVNEMVAGSGIQFILMHARLDGGLAWREEERLIVVLRVLLS